MNWLALITGVVSLLNWLIAKAHDAGQIKIGETNTLTELLADVQARVKAASDARAGIGSDSLRDHDDYERD